MPDRDAHRLDRKIDQISDELPESAGAFLRWLRTPSSRWVRLPLALLLIVGGVVGFLPVLGFLDDPARRPVTRTGCALPSEANIAGADVVGAEMDQMEGSAFPMVVKKMRCPLLGDTFSASGA